MGKDKEIQCSFTRRKYREDVQGRQEQSAENLFRRGDANHDFQQAYSGSQIWLHHSFCLALCFGNGADFGAEFFCIDALLDRLAVFGLVKIIGYCSKDLYRLAFQFDLAFGILLLALGLILILRTQAVVNVIWVLVGIFILSDALLKIQISIDARLFGIHQWWMILTAAIITGTIGFLLVLHPSESKQVVMVLLGISLFCEGILNLVTILTAVKIIRKQHPNRLEADFVQKNEEIL